MSIFAAEMTTTHALLQLADAALAATNVPDWPADTFLHREALSSPTLPDGQAVVEWHPLIPFLPQNTRVLFLGSFPPQRKRWCMDFFYPNFINDHWRIEGLVFYGDTQHFVDPEAKTFRLHAIVEHLKHHGIGFFDTAIAVRRLADNASDKFLEVVAPTDIRAMVEHLPELRAVVTTGVKATETIAAAISAPFHDIELCRLPSSSRAYPMALTKKAEAYKTMFERYLR